MKLNIEAGTFDLGDDNEGEITPEAASWIWWIIAIFVVTILVEVAALYILLALTRSRDKPMSTKTLVVLGSGGQAAWELASAGRLHGSYPPLRQASPHSSVGLIGPIIGPPHAVL